MKKIILILLFALLPVLSVNAEEFSKRELLEKIGVISSGQSLESIRNQDLLSFFLKGSGRGDTDNEALIDYARAIGISGADEEYLSKSADVNETCRIIVSILGYNTVLAKGRTPISVAAEIKLLNGAEQAEGYFTQSGMETVLYNMLEAQMLEKRYYDGVTINSGNFLNGYLKVYKQTGIVTAVHGWTMSGQDVVNSRNIAVDSVLYSCSIENKEDFFAKKVDFYYKTNDDGELEILYMNEIGDSVTVINAANLLDVQYKEGLYTIEYDDLKAKKYRVKARPKYIGYNGETLDITDVDMAALLDFYLGELVLIDYDKDGAADTLLISQYENYFVNFAGTDVLYDAYGKEPLKFYFDDSDYSYEFIKDGKEAKYTDIKTNNVVSIYSGVRGKNIKIIISDKKIGGKIVSKSERNGRDFVEIDYFPYYTSFTGDELNPGDNGTVYLDVNGVIGGYKVSSTLFCGYLIKAYYDDSEDRAVLKIYTTNDEIEEMTAKEDVLVQLGNNTEKCDIKKLLGYLNDGTETKRSAVKYAVNSSVIKKIVLPTEGMAEGNSTFNCAQKNVESIYGGGKIGRFAYDAQTWFIYAPTDQNANVDRYYLSANDLVSGTSYDADVYDTDDFNKSKVVVIYKDSLKRVKTFNSIGQNKSLAVVESVKAVEEYDEAEEEVVKYWSVKLALDQTVRTVKINRYEQGLYYSTAETNRDSDLVNTVDACPIDEGDVVQCDIQDGKLLAVRWWLDYSTNCFNSSGVYGPTTVPGYNIGRYGTYSSNQFHYGNVKNISDELIIIDTTNPQILEKYASHSLIGEMGVNVFPVTYAGLTGVMFDRSKKTVEPVTKKDIRVGDDIIFNYIDQKMYSFVLIR